MHIGAEAPADENPTCDTFVLIFAGQRLLLLSALGLAVFMVSNGVPIAFDAMAGAYLAVAVFVAATLFLVLAAECRLKTDLGAWLNRHRAFQVPISTLLSALPGCLVEENPGKDGLEVFQRHV